MTMFSDVKYETAKLFMYQIVMAVFGLVTVMATTKSVPLTLICAVLGIGLYVFLVYNMMWDIGAKDRIKADAGRYEYSAMKPFLMALVAGIPNLLFGGLCVFRLAGGAVFQKIARVGETVAKLINGHFLGAVKLTRMLENPFVWVLVAIICIIVPVLGYNAGYRGFALIPALHRDKKEKE